MLPDGQDNPKRTAHAANILPNVILITLDAFNYQVLMDNIESFPHFKRLRSRSVSFENAFSVGPTTPFAFPGIIAGVYPYHFGVGINKHIKPLYAVLKDCGYHTAFVNEANALLAPFFGYDRDMDYQEHFLNLSHDNEDRDMAGVFLKRGEEKISRRSLKKSFRILDRFRFRGGVVAKRVRSLFFFYRFFKLYLTNGTNSFSQRAILHSQFRDEVLSFINKRFQRPQFLWIHTMVTHLPYFPSASSFSEGEINHLNYMSMTRVINRKNCEKAKLLYIESVKRTDELIGDIAANLENSGLFDNTILVVTADHGEEFKEEGYFGHENESSSDRLLHVPLMFCWPDKLEARRISTPVSTLDILATVTDILGLKSPETNRGISHKAVLNGEQDDICDPNHWQRPLFSEAWERDGLLDKKPGHESERSIRRIFTIRRGRHKLKLIQMGKAKGTLKEEAELRDWIDNKRLNLEDDSLINKELYQLLYKHIQEEGDFAAEVKKRAEKRRIKDILGRIA